MVLPKQKNNVRKKLALPRATIVPDKNGGDGSSANPPLWLRLHSRMTQVRSKDRGLHVDLSLVSSRSLLLLFFTVICSFLIDFTLLLRRTASIFYLNYSKIAFLGCDNAFYLFPLLEALLLQLKDNNNINGECIDDGFIAISNYLRSMGKE